MKIALVAGGPESELADIRSFIDQDLLWVGVDRGVLYLLKRGIRVSRAFGDFDSVTLDEFQKIQNHVPDVMRVRAEKNETDLELALLWAMQQNPETIYIFGATGGRLDHFFGNVNLLLKKQFLTSHIDIRIVDQRNQLSLYEPGCYQVLPDPNLTYCSFFSILGDVTGLTLEGFKYPLRNHTIETGSTLCVSNELIRESGTFSFGTGILMMVRSSDAEAV
ncbi:thiamine pyrophosphokinase [Bacillus ectoiniformans]|uniref:thiamine diphosphokinase n=1 Tax=Bacillus ectoiniformans TaxID=1494429 RepID=UPI00195A257C|nr:thiamine diphosphokinase [Bacillus ectoiniformans]MBM7647174.1 thiamine pyrophosphokinase [Bacillus ectoiniformans]